MGIKLTAVSAGKRLGTLTLGCLFILPLHAEENASIVYGSYGSLAGAETTRQQLESRLAEALEIREVEIRGNTYFRILGMPDTDLDRARGQLARIKDSVAADAWLLLGTFEPAPKDPYLSLKDPDPLIARPDEPVTRKPRSPLPPAGSSGSKPQQPKHSSFARLPGYGNAKESSPKPQPNTTVARIRSSPPSPRAVSAPLVMQPSPSGGIDATEEPLIIPKYDTVDIKVDGLLDEEIWAEVQGYDNMTVTQPDTMESPPHATVIKFLYTDEGLYMGAWAEQPPEKLIKRFSSRDENINRDGLSLTLDTSGKGLYGFFFGVSLGGTMSDGTVLPEWQFSHQWDGPWQGNAVETDTGYTTEMFLPWSMMAMPDAPDVRKMGFYVSRQVGYLSERWSWPALPFTRSKFMSALQPIQMERVTPRQQFTSFPFSSATRDNMYGETDYRVGFDLFWRPSSDLQLTATVNPDFGTVESDDVVINLTAFETFFPEKRLFFLEGNEIFITSPRSAVLSMSSGTGARGAKYSFSREPTSLVNTRRIGGAAPSPDIPDDVTVSGVERGKPTELSGAVKVTGQKGSFRYGALAAFEDEGRLRGYKSDGTPHRIEQDGRDFGVVRILYEDASNGRRSLGWISTLTSHPQQDAMVHGVDVHYQSPDSKLYWDGQFMYSDVADVEGFGSFLDLSYAPSQGRTNRLSIDYFDDQLDVDDFGYIRRNDSINLRYSYSYSTSASERFLYRSKYWILNQEYNTDGRSVQSAITWNNRWTFHNRSQVGTGINYYPAHWDDRNSFGNGDYRVLDRWGWRLSYGTDSSRKISFSTGVSARQEDLTDWSYTAESGITFKPNDRFSLDLDVTYGERHGWVIYRGERDFTSYNAINWQPRLTMDLFFTARQQLRWTMQWAGIDADEHRFYQVPVAGGHLIEVRKESTEASDDFTISRLTTQLRYRWELAPLSDLFVVYTRGGNLPSREDDGFGDLFHDVLTDPIIDLFVIKLRYRFGN